MTAIVLADPVCSDGAALEAGGFKIPLSIPSDPCDHSRSGVASWTFPVKHSQAGYYAIVGQNWAGAVPFNQPGFVLSVDGESQAGSSGILGGVGAFFDNGSMTATPGPFPHTVCDWPWPSWFIAVNGFTPHYFPGQEGFWLSAGTHTLTVQFTAWDWDFVQDDADRCSDQWVVHFIHFDLLAGIPCPGYVYGTPDLPAVRLTINPDAPTGLRLTVPAGKHLRLTING